MAKTIFKASAVLGGLGLSALLQQQVSADSQSHTTAIQNDGVFLGKPVKLRGSQPINAQPIKPRSDFEWVQNNGTDLKKVNINGSKRAPNVKLTLQTKTGSILVGSGAFIGNSTILTVAHNFLGIDADTEVTKVTVTIGSNSEVDEAWNTTSGYSFDIPLEDIHFFDKSTYLQYRDDSNKTAPYDLATIRTKIPYQLIVNELKKKGVDLGTYNTLELAGDEEISRINNSANDLTGEHVRMYGYPGANLSDQVYFNPKLEQGYLYEVDTTVTNTEFVPDYGSLGDVRFTKIRNTTMGGMSGSNLMNANGQVIGVHQSSTNRNPKTDTPENEKNWRATQMLINNRHKQWLRYQIDEDSRKGFVEYDGNKYYYDKDGTFLRNTTKEVTIDGVTKVYEFDDSGVAKEKLESTEPSKPNTPTVEEPKPNIPAVEEPKDKVEEPKPSTPTVEEPKDKVEEPKPSTPTVEEPKDKVEEPKHNTPAVEEPKDKVEEPKPNTPAVEEPKDKVEEPKHNKPTVEEPKPDKPTVEEPKDKAEEPKPDKPTVEEPKDKVEEPKPDKPTVEEPKDKAEEPKPDKPTVEEPKDKVEEPKPDKPTVEEPKDKVEEPTNVSETTQDTIKYQQTIVKDDTILKGERKLIQAGKDGVKNIIRTWALKDGQKIGEPIVNEVITTPAVDEIVHVGTREDLMEIDFEKTPSGGRRAVINFYSIAEGKRVGETRKYTHLLRPTNKIVTQTREKVRESRQNPERTESAIRKLYASFKSLSVRRLK